MPKKPNRWKQPQNYVPKGNGDASGEYANDGGSNVHFTSFAKPDEDGKTGIGIKDTGNGKKPIYTGKKHTKEETQSIIQKAMGYKRKSVNVDRVVEQFESDNWDDGIKSLVLDTLGSGKYKIVAEKNGEGYFKPYNDEIHFSSEKGSGYVSGGVITHEVGHAIDYSYKNENGERGLWSKDYKSKKYNKTMFEMLDEELEKANDDGAIDEILKKYKDYKNELENKRNNIQADFDKLDDLYREKMRDYWLAERNAIDKDSEYKILAKKRNEAFDNYYDGKMKFSEYKKIRDEIDQKQREKENEIKKKLGLEIPAGTEELKEQRNKKWEEYKKANEDISHKPFIKYGDLSDILQGKFNYKFCGGHSLKYFSGINRDKTRATECFAEIQSALGTNNESLEVLQKVIPKTIEIYKEIIGGLSKND